MACLASLESSQIQLNFCYFFGFTYLASWHNLLSTLSNLEAHTKCSLLQGHRHHRLPLPQDGRQRRRRRRHRDPGHCPAAVPHRQGHVRQQQANLLRAGRPTLQVDRDDAGHEDGQVGLPRGRQTPHDRRGAAGGAQVSSEGLLLLV